MKIRALALPLVAFAALLSGCASGPKFAAVAPTLTRVNPDSGRIYFYRTAVLGAAIQPNVTVNGEVVGTSKPEGFFFVDRPAGNYEVITATEVTRKLSLTLDKGQTRYVRLNISMGFLVGHVYPELVDTATGEKEIQECSYTGQAATGAQGK
jgi:Protein of unknown function (DUF2846)